jgi:hypothetical protein
MSEDHFSLAEFNAMLNHLANDPPAKMPTIDGKPIFIDSAPRYPAGHPILQAAERAGYAVFTPEPPTGFGGPK